MFNENCTATVQEKNTKNVQAIETPYIFAQIPRKHFAKKCFYSVKKKCTNYARKTNMDAYSKQKLGLASTKFIFKKNCEIPRESLRNTQENLRIFF